MEAHYKWTRAIGLHVNVLKSETRREAQAMALKRQRPEVREREAQAMVLKRQRPEVREREARAKALKRQCPEVRKREAHAKKHSRIKQSSIPLSVLQASEAFIMATREGPDYTCVSCNRLMYR